MYKTTYNNWLLKKDFIIDYLDDIWFYIWNSDWEFSEPAFFKVVKELFEYIEESNDIIKDIKYYLNKFYPYNI